MGNCLNCRNKRDTSETDQYSSETNQNANTDSLNHHSGRNHSRSIDRKQSDLSERVDQLVKETLEVIASIVDE